MLGARTNWILHFARSPRFAQDVKVIQVDIQAEEHHNSIKSEVAIQSDMEPAVSQLSAGLKKLGYTFNSQNDWWKELLKKCNDNQKTIQVCLIFWLRTIQRSTIVVVLFMTISYINQQFINFVVLIFPHIYKPPILTRQ